MLSFKIDEKNHIVELQPQGALQEDDFPKLTDAVDKLIEEKGQLAGLIIETESFPGWESFEAMKTHFKFIKDHHKKIKKIALVTDTPIANIAESLISHFIEAKIKKFPAAHYTEAKAWIVDNISKD